MQSVVQSSATATTLVPSQGDGSATVIVQNRSGGDVYIGGADVSADDSPTGGYLIPDTQDFGFVLPPGIALFVIGAAGPVSVLVVS